MRKNTLYDISVTQVEAPLDDSVSCEMCEFAVTVIDERLDDEATIDQVPRYLRFDPTTTSSD